MLHGKNATDYVLMIFSFQHSAEIDAIEPRQLIMSCILIIIFLLFVALQKGTLSNLDKLIINRFSFQHFTDSTDYVLIIIFFPTLPRKGRHRASIYIYILRLDDAPFCGALVRKENHYIYILRLSKSLRDVI